MSVCVSPAHDDNCYSEPRTHCLDTENHGLLHSKLYLGHRSYTGQVKSQ